MDGVLVVDKPVGPTSHDVVARVRRAIGERRIGHTGTLDPAASGVLPLVIGRATRLARFLTASDKSYEAVVRLGVTTDTGDAQGHPAGPEYRGAMPSDDEIASSLLAFCGTFSQRPPAFSAKKINGQRSYRLARARHRATGAADPAQEPPVSEVPAPVAVTVHGIDIVKIEGSAITLRLECSAGFYVRALARDLGERLGTGGHLLTLRRTQSGDFTTDDTIALDDVERNPGAARAAVVPLAGMLRRFSWVVLTTEGAHRAVHGRELGPGDVARRVDIGTDGGAISAVARTAAAGWPAWVRLFDEHGALIGVAQCRGSSDALHPSVVLV
jgi:tRNA pseudouridine55 synthase